MKKIFLILLMVASLFAKMEYSDPQPTFDNPRKWIINLHTNDNYIVKEYPQEGIKIAVVAYAKGMRVIKKDYDPKTLSRIRSLMEYDVEFIGCRNTMETMNWKEEDFIDGIEYEQAGIAAAIEKAAAGWIPMTPY